MRILPVDSIVIFVGGPNHGVIEIGATTLGYTVDLELPKEGEPGKSYPLEGARAQIGRRMKGFCKYSIDAGQKIGMPRALELWAKYGVGPIPTPVYELTQIDEAPDADVFVYKYIGEYSDVYPKEKTS
jgi:hypothetical protein